MAETLFDAKAGKAKAWTTAEVYAGLRAMFCGPSHAMICEVANRTGASASRSADALAMSLWPSRGVHLLGFEVKSSRSDWVKERDDPAKAEAIARYCDYWYLVVGHADLVKPGELPATWGLIAPKGNRLAVVTEPTRLKPAPVTREFLAAMFRRLVEKVERDDEVNAAFRKGKEEGRAEGVKLGKESAGWEAKRAAESLGKLQKAVDEFEEASGLRIDQWHGGKDMGRAVKALKKAVGYGQDPLEEVVRSAKRTLERAEALLDAKAIAEGLTKEEADA